MGRASEGPIKLARTWLCPLSPLILYLQPSDFSLQSLLGLQPLLAAVGADRSVGFPHTHFIQLQPESTDLIADHVVNRHGDVLDGGVEISELWDIQV